MIRLTTFAATGLVALTLTASAAPALQRIRGTVESAADGSLVLKTTDGKSTTLTIAPTTKYLYVVKASLDDIKDGVFIGTATKGEPPVALEVVLFPEAARGTGEGHYDWDEITDTTAGGAPVKSSMTNGTIKAVAKPVTKSAMTNGTVKAGTGAGGTKKLTVAYGDKSIDITVPPSAPIVAFQPADMSAVKPGAHVFVIAAVDGAKLTANRVAVGKDGLTPPM
jgi:hypothetical protein